MKAILAALMITTPAHAMEFVSISDAVMVGHGPMILDDYKRLVEKVREYPNTRALYLDSSGGYSRSGFLLGEVIRRLNLNVIIHEDDACWSACAWAAIGGKTVTIKGRLGFHRSYVKPTKQLSTEEIDDLVQAGQFVGSYLTHYTLRMGYHIELATGVVTYTSKYNYLVFKNTASLKLLKRGGTDLKLNKVLTTKWSSHEWIQRHLEEVYN
jgi:hypothetical protein